MCDYSLHNVKSRPAKVGGKLTTRHVAVCVLPGTELSFNEDVRRVQVWPWAAKVIHHKTAIFRQINQHDPQHHHDALEFPDGQTVLLHFLKEGQQATVLQLPASVTVPRFRSARPTCSRSALIAFRSRPGGIGGTYLALAMRRASLRWLRTALPALFRPHACARRRRRDRAYPVSFRAPWRLRERPSNASAIPSFPPNPHCVATMR
jgi:hypothetical protein